MTAKTNQTENDDTAAQHNSGNVTPIGAAPDPFNLSALRLPPSFEETAGVRKMITTVPVRKPHKQEWIRVHPGDDYRNDFATIHLKQDDEFYIVMPHLIEDLRKELTFMTIYTAINRAGGVFLWPIRRLGGDSRGPGYSWHCSAHECAAAAMKRVTRVSSGKEKGIDGYDPNYSDNPIPDSDPVWPDLTFEELVNIGFGKLGRIVVNFEHPVIKLLRGM